MFENAYKITSKSKLSTQNVQIPYHLHPTLSYSLQDLSNEDKSFLRKDTHSFFCLQKLCLLFLNQIYTLQYKTTKRT